MNLEEIIEYCKKGNQLAQKLLFEQNYARMYNLSMRMIASSHDVEDILSTVFTKVFKNIRRFEYQGDNSFNKWLKTITINESIRFLKAKKKLKYTEPIEDIYHEEFLYEESELEINIEDVYRILEDMPDGYRMVFNLYAIEDYTHKSIAKALGVSINTSKSQLRKARKFIIQKLKENSCYGKARY